MIKYLGSKRTLIPAIEALVQASGAQTGLDLFTGTTRVAQSMKRLGLDVAAADIASYSYVFAKTWIELDGNRSESELDSALSELNATKGEAGYFTQEFCIDARYFQPANGERIDAIRNCIETDYKSTWMYYPLLTALILAADRVDSTTGIQMAFLKQWAARSFKTMQLTAPEFIAGHGSAWQGDALELTARIGPVDLAYLDPPYNQHRYFTNYHVWETLVRWDNPQSYGIARKRIDSRDDATKSPFNSKRTMPGALEQLVQSVQAETVILSYNDDSWLSREDLVDMCRVRGDVALLEFDFKRYVGSQIGIYNKKGERVGTPGRARNREWMLIAGERDRVRKMAAATQTQSITFA